MKPLPFIPKIVCWRDKNCPTVDLRATGPSADAKCIGTFPVCEFYNASIKNDRKRFLSAFVAIAEFYHYSKDNLRVGDIFVCTEQDGSSTVTVVASPVAYSGDKICLVSDKLPAYKLILLKEKN